MLPPATPATAAIDEIAAVFQALGHPQRVLIVHLLRNGEVCVCDLVAALGLPQSTVSRQLAILREAGVVRARRDGRWMHYRLATDLSPLCASVIGALLACDDLAPPTSAIRTGCAP